MYACKNRIFWHYMKRRCMWYINLKDHLQFKVASSPYKGYLSIIRAQHAKKTCNCLLSVFLKLKHFPAVLTCVHFTTQWILCNCLYSILFMLFVLSHLLWRKGSHHEFQPQDVECRHLNLFHEQPWNRTALQSLGVRITWPSLSLNTFMLSFTSFPLPVIPTPSRVIFYNLLLWHRKTHKTKSQ